MGDEEAGEEQGDSGAGDDEEGGVVGAPRPAGEAQQAAVGNAVGLPQGNGDRKEPGQGENLVHGYARNEHVYVFE